MLERLDYDNVSFGSSPGELRKKYEEINAELKAVITRHSGFFGLFRGNLNRKEVDSLLIGHSNLYHLETINNICQSSRKARGEPLLEETLSKETIKLHSKILKYMARFKNTGVIEAEGGYWVPLTL